MNEIPLCSIVISSQLPKDEIDSLETSLRMSSIKVQKLPSRVFGADDIVFIATVLGGMAAGANLIEYGIKAAKTIANWRRELRSRGIEPEGRLEHPNRPPLELNEASDEEIDQWFPHE
ncbi:MAG: hypothetical protein AAGE84_04825 [Cyanobacteria bacterium P01_G01_bin.39]